MMGTIAEAKPEKRGVLKEMAKTACKGGACVFSRDCAVRL